MFVLGHMGIGSELARPFSQGLPRRWLLLGTVLPDLIDKPLYYGLVWETGRRGDALGLISGTRTFGHTAALTLAVMGIALWRRSRVLAALALGMATHLLLDNLMEVFVHAHGYGLRGTIYALLFPLLGWKFPVIPFDSVGQHLASLLNPWLLGAEILGAALLAWDWWKRRNERDILLDVRRRKIHFKFPGLDREWRKPKRQPE